MTSNGLNIIFGDGSCCCAARKRYTSLQGSSLPATARLWCSRERLTSGLHAARTPSIGRLAPGIICLSQCEQSSSEIECAKALTREIVEAKNWRQLVDCLEKSRDYVNLRHMTTALYFLSKFPVRLCLHSNAFLENSRSESLRINNLTWHVCRRQRMTRCHINYFKS